MIYSLRVSPPPKKKNLGAHLPHSAPLLQRVSSREVPDVHNEISSGLRATGCREISSERSCGRGCAEILGDPRTAAGLNSACHCQWHESLYWPRTAAGLNSTCHCQWHECLYWPRRGCVVSWRSWPIYIDDHVTMVSDVKYVLGVRDTKNVIQNVQIYAITFKYHIACTQNSYGQEPWPSAWKIPRCSAIITGTVHIAGKIRLCLINLIIHNAKHMLQNSVFFFNWIFSAHCRPLTYDKHPHNEEVNHHPPSVLIYI